MERDAFVIMPFSPTPSCQDWTEIYNHVFEPALKDLGWHCERAAPTTGSLIASIVERLNAATVVLADLTDRNANVFYELGVRHSISLRTIMVSQHADHVPSDLKGYWYINYGITPARVAQFRTDLQRVLSEIEKAPDRNDNPVADYLAKNDQSISRLTNRDNLKKLNALSTELTGNISELITLAKKNGKPSLSANSPIFQTRCLSLLLDTYYVDVGPTVLALAYELRRDLERLQVGATLTSSTKQIMFNARSFLETIKSIREQIQRGTFVEPSIPSLMEWSPNLRGATNWTCAFCNVAVRSDSTVCDTCGSALSSSPGGRLKKQTQLRDSVARCTTLFDGPDMMPSGVTQRILRRDSRKHSADTRKKPVK
jgi:hypothetical protein